MSKCKKYCILKDKILKKIKIEARFLRVQLVRGHDEVVGKGKSPKCLTVPNCWMLGLNRICSALSQNFRHEFVEDYQQRVLNCVNLYIKCALS